MSTFHIPRLSPAERAAIRKIRILTYDTVVRCQEPALGTLEERLDIIVRRLGGRTRLPRLTAKEREQYRSAS